MKTIIVTGANSGLGLWTTKHLLDLGYKVIMACRSVEKAQKAIADFEAFDRSKPYEIVHLDLGDFGSIRQFVDKLSAEEPVFGLDCNAGLSYEGPFRYTKNGIEETFGTNYLGHFLLTNLLLQKFKLQRIVLISSELHNPNNKSPFAKAAFQSVETMAHPTVDPQSTLEKQAQSFYATSKLCDVLLAYELDRRLRQAGNSDTLVNAMNPGLMLTTNLGRKNTCGENFYRKLLDLFFKLIGLADYPEKSAQAAAQLIDQPKGSGAYYDKTKKIPSSTDSYDLEKARLLWEGSEVLVGEEFL